MSEFTNSEAFQTFFTGVATISQQHSKQIFPNSSGYDFAYTEGRKYVKIIRRDFGGAGGSVHCFVDKTNGNVLKGASWNAPAKHARGNIFKSDNGLKCMGPYGAAYLR